MAAACPPTPPAVVSRVEADFPELARKMNSEGGTAIVKLDLDGSGKVAKSSVQKSAGNGALDAAAVKAARETSYKPATEGCKPVASVYLMVVDMRP